MLPLTLVDWKLQIMMSEVPSVKPQPEGDIFGNNYKLFTISEGNTISS
jgi:hypothetical protein